MKKYFSLSLCLVAIAMGVFFSCASDDGGEGVNGVLPTVTTATPSFITQTTATGGGIVIDNGGAVITSRGICWSTAQNPTTSDAKTTESGTMGVFASEMAPLVQNTTYYVRAYAKNIAGTAYGAQISFTTAGNGIVLPTVTTTEATAVSATTATLGGDVTDEGGGPITERGFCVATTENPTLTDDTFAVDGTTGPFSFTVVDLLPTTTYYTRSYATNAGGTAYGEQVTFTTTAAGTTTGPVDGDAICDGTQPTAVVPVTSATGKIWMDRNLGASRAAISSTDFHAYGCLYQWGRGNDGHASINWVMGEDDDWGNQAGTAVNGVTTTLSSSDTPDHALFIADQGSMPYDWRSPKNDNLWQGVNGINNPCPDGYRIPTQAEFQAEITAYAITGPTSAYNSIHKLPLAGDRAFDSGSVRGQGEDAFFWTSTVDSGDAYNVLIQAGAVYTNTGNGRAGGFSVRCIKN